MGAPPSAKDVAEFMAQEFEKDGWLNQSDAVWDIEKKFGNEFLYTNENGNPAISRAVLKEFRKLTDKTAVWERGGRYWRRRDDSDDPNRRSTDY